MADLGHGGPRSWRASVTAAPAPSTVPADLRRHFGDCIFSTDLVASYEAPGVPISHIVLLPPDVPNENTGNIPNEKAYVRKSSGASARSAGVCTGLTSGFSLPLALCDASKAARCLSISETSLTANRH